MRKSFALKASLLAAVLVGSSIPWAASTSAAPATPSSGPNPIVIENRHAGSDHWKLPWTGFQVGEDIHLQVKGYAGNETTSAGGSVALKITVTPDQNFVVDVFRLGCYGGLGGRLMTHLGPFSGGPQQPCVTNPDTRMLACDWLTSVNLNVPHNWISGVYVAVVSTASKYQSLVPFWVINDTATPTCSTTLPSTPTRRTTTSLTTRRHRILRAFPRPGTASTTSTVPAAFPPSRCPSTDPSTHSTAARAMAGCMTSNRN